MLFKDIPGQQAVKKRLINSVNEARISHAQLFLGPEGSGSLALALAYAQYISCLEKLPDDSCGKCSACTKYQKLIHPDLHFSYPFITKASAETSVNYIKEWRNAIAENPFMGIDQWMEYLDADNKQPNINIAECHAIIQKLVLKSFEAEYKIILIWLPEYLGAAGNSLLKLIEEPPAKTLFILIAQNYEQILATILSRTQLIKIPKLADEELKAYLIDNGCPQEKAGRIAYLANGNIAAAQQLLAEDDDDLESLFIQWFRLCYGRKGVEINDWIEQVANARFGRENQKSLLRFGLQVVRDCLMVNLDQTSIVKFESKHFELTKLANTINFENAPLIIKGFEQAIYHIERNANPKIMFLDLSIQMMRNLQLKNVNSQLTINE
jgi:DNA polymerase-3 subunit delta'